MEYDRLGNSGLRVSRISLGCMSFGDPSRGFNEWSLGEEDAGPFFKQAVELGITFWDTANVTAPIVGATKSHHLAYATASIDIHLTDDEIRALEEPYTPCEPAGF
jgi:aryl-alcohol dehydrogenase-like predicted oxidoreductase